MPYWSRTVKIKPFGHFVTLTMRPQYDGTASGDDGEASPTGLFKKSLLCNTLNDGHSSVIDYPGSDRDSQLIADKWSGKKVG